MAVRVGRLGQEFAHVASAVCWLDDSPSLSLTCKMGTKSILQGCNEAQRLWILGTHPSQSLILMEAVNDVSGRRAKPLCRARVRLARQHLVNTQDLAPSGWLPVEQGPLLG